MELVSYIQECILALYLESNPYSSLKEVFKFGRILSGLWSCINGCL